MNLDTRLFLDVNQHIPAWLGTVFYVLTLIGSPSASLGWLVVIAAFSFRDRFRRLAYCLSSLVVAMGIDEALKYLIARPRPWRVLPMAHTIGRLQLDPSFPSGHATAAFTLAVAVSFAWPKLRGAPLLFAAGVAFSRLVVGMHYPSDVLVGALLGTTISMLFWFSWAKRQVRGALEAPAARSS